MEPSASEPPLNLIIRFPFSLPDLPLIIAHPSTSTAATLNQLIRPHLPVPFSISRLRLIHSGAVLPPYIPLLTSLHLPALPRPNPKGKSPIYPSPTIYIHCSPSPDTLTPAELAREAVLAAPTPVPSTSTAKDDTSNPLSRAHTLSPTSTTPAPRGFDRLLSAGLSQQEIVSLRSQFLAIQAHTHTPDTMPSPTTLRAMEDRWLDNGSGGLGGGSGGGAGGMEGLESLGSLDDGEEGAGLDDMLWGNVVGFFWPLGAVVWGLREEGVWSKRRQIAVVTGFLVNVAFCVLRVTS